METILNVYCPRRRQHNAICETPNACAGGADCRLGPSLEYQRMEQAESHRQRNREYSLKKRNERRNERATKLEKIIGKPVPDYMTVRAMNIIMVELGENFDGAMLGDTKARLEYAMNMPRSNWLLTPNCGHVTYKLILQYLYGDNNEV